MNQKDVSIATITWARNDSEEAVLRNSLTHLARLNIPVFIADGGSQASFLAFLDGFPQFTLTDCRQPGVWPQTKTSLAAAYRTGTPFILYTEPDKAGFFADSLPTLLNGITVDEQSGVTLISRSSRGFASFPAFQQMTETTINRCCAEVMGKEIDYVYGPFLLNRELVPYLETLDPSVGWGWRPYAFHIAKRLSYRLEAHTGDFFCPEDQQQDTPKERIYRMRQLSQNLEGLILSTTVAL